MYRQTILPVDVQFSVRVVDVQFKGHCCGCADQESALWAHRPKVTVIIVNVKDRCCNCEGQRSVFCKGQVSQSTCIG